MFKTDTALVYPGVGIFEGSNVSEGRGTTKPFEIVGGDIVFIIIFLLLIFIIFFFIKYFYLNNLNVKLLI